VPRETNYCLGTTPPSGGPQSQLQLTMLYDSDEEDGRLITIKNPAEGGLEETDVVMNATKKQIRLTKFGNVCHFDTLKGTVYPLDLAVGIGLIANGDCNHSVKDDVEEHVIFIYKSPMTEEESLFQKMKNLCYELPLKNIKEKPVTNKEGNDLKNGRIVLRTRNKTSSCDLKQAMKKIKSGGWRFPAKNRSELWIHQRIHSVENIPCCQDKKTNCCKENHPDLWECKIFQPETFDCLIKPPGPGRIAVIVAGGESDSAPLDSVEILTEDDSGNYETRQVYIKDIGCTGACELPVASAYVTGALFNNLPHVCNGITGQCFKFELDGSWEKEFNWVPSKSAAAYPVFSVVFDDDMMFLPSEKGSAVWAGQPPSLIDIDIERPSQADLICVAKISDSEAFVFARPKFSWIFNIQHNNWTSLKDSSATGAGPACGFLETSGGKYVVLAGGRGTSKTEILDLNTNKWEQGPDIGVDLFGASMVSIENNKKLLLVGGNSTSASSEIRTMDKNMDSWTTVGNLRTSRFSSVAYAVPIQNLPTLCPC